MKLDIKNYSDIHTPGDLIIREYNNMHVNNTYVLSIYIGGEYALKIGGIGKLFSDFISFDSIGSVEKLNYIDHNKNLIVGKLLDKPLLNEIKKIKSGSTFKKLSLIDRFGDIIIKSLDPAKLQVAIDEINRSNRNS